jgi:hypothetical protein
MNDTLPSRSDIEALIRSKLIVLIRLSSERGIRIAALMHEALEHCDAEPPFNRR